MLVNCHTYYSFCYGTLSIEQLLDEVQQKGYSSFALTDINNTSACLDTLRLLSKPNKWNLKPVIGIDFRNGTKQQYIGIAINNAGFKELNEHLSAHLHSGTPFEDVAPEFNNAYIIYPFLNYKNQTLRENEFVGVAISDLWRLPFSPIRNNVNKLLALHTLSFTSKKHYNAHRLLRAVDTNTLLSKLKPEEQGNLNDMLLSKTELIKAYADFPGIIGNTEAILSHCHVNFEFGKLANKNKKYFTGNAHDDIQLLRR